MVNHTSAPTCPVDDYVPAPASAVNIASYVHAKRGEQLSLERPTGCQIGIFVNTETGEVRWCPCGLWRCTGCGKRKVRRFIRRIQKRQWMYLATFTLEGDGKVSKENLSRLNKGWRVWLRWAQRRQKAKFGFTWVNEQGGQHGRIHKHVLLDCGRIDYNEARSAVVRAGLGRVVDFQKVRSGGANFYVAKYLGKSLGVEWPKYTRRCQTTEPDLEGEAGWVLMRRHVPRRLSKFDDWRSGIANKWENYDREAEGYALECSASLDTNRESASEDTS